MLFVAFYFFFTQLTKNILIAKITNKKNSYSKNKTNKKNPTIKLKNIGLHAFDFLCQ